jgi:adenylate kinase
MDHAIAIIVLHGLPGSGKGTLARQLVQTVVGASVLTCGDLIRSEALLPTDIGYQLASCLTMGELAPDSLVTELVLARLRAAIPRGQVILDGFPRTPTQAAVLSGELIRRALPPPIVLDLRLPIGTAIDRISQRRSCAYCGTIYNLESCPPRADGRCDRDGHLLAKRPGEDNEGLLRRMTNYARAYDVLSAYYIAECYAVVTLDATKRIADVAMEALSWIDPANGARTTMQTLA